MNNVAELIQKEHWQGLLVPQKEEELIHALQAAPVVEVADFLAQLSPTKTLGLLTKLSVTTQGAIFAEFDEEYQSILYRLADKKDFANIFSHMPSGHRADFYQKLDGKEQARLLPYLTKKVREDVIALSAYPSETAGSIMSTDFATVLGDRTVKEAIQKLKEDAPSKKMIYYIYVVDANMRMIGFVSLKDLIMADPDEPLAKSLHENFIYAIVDEDQEAVAEKIEKYGLVAMPILNEEGQLVGIVSYDDAIEVIRREQTEDMERFMGIVSDEETADYMKASSFQHFKKRVAWIVGLFVAGFLSTLVIHKHENLLGRITALSMYLPMIAATGGNAGSQAASVVIRALSLGQITLSDWLGIILKEAKVAILLAMFLFVLAFMKVLLLSSFDTLESYNVYRVAFTIGLALSIQVINSTIIGASLPLIAKYFNGDPAVAASPAITTIVDITGMIIYFTVAMAVLF
ncbi:MAG: magnesium transporter [Candidatus Amoebophilus sp. 36-38]|nr:MAG: magnesium transporter [Candidatus Amoebophilus sp. 36-38]